ncbi:MAG: hypothetical protein IIW52_01150 [Alistipes sp.]|nr:hypothetical protein [Alistipes sp.]
MRYSPLAAIVVEAGMSDIMRVWLLLMPELVVFVVGMVTDSVLQAKSLWR